MPQESPQTKIPPSRLRVLSGRPPRAQGDYILYWMVAARRTQRNFALERAVEWCRTLDRPLVVLEALRCDYPWASARHHAFILRGMLENRQRLAVAGAFPYSYAETAPGQGKGLLRALARRACAVITDEAPLFFLGRMVERAAGGLDVRTEAVDGNGLLPVRCAEKVYPTAAAFRRFLHQALPEQLADFPVENPLRRLTAVAAPDLGKLHRRWPMVDLEGPHQIADFVAGLPIDQQVAAVSEAGGGRRGRQLLQQFLDRHLKDYGASGRRTLENSSSGLSPYLHYGQVGSHQVVHALFKHEGWEPGRIQPANRGKREGWWGLSIPAETFLDQLVTWRELGLNMHTLHPQPELFTSLPPWARETLEQHAGDPRPHVYSRRQFEEARTHDELWNAAQRQLIREGTIHNYLRMLWGKKILEWSRSPREALKVMLHLNNKYALDGRDPNSTSGIFWILGRYDRPWFPERPVFGRIRYMSSANTARKMSVKGYLARYGPNLPLV